MESHLLKCQSDTFCLEEPFARANLNFFLLAWAIEKHPLQLPDNEHKYDRANPLWMSWIFNIHFTAANNNKKQMSKFFFHRSPVFKPPEAFPHVHSVGMHFDFLFVLYSPPISSSLWENHGDMAISITECRVQWMWHKTLRSSFLLTDLNSLPLSDAVNSAVTGIK